MPHIIMISTNQFKNGMAIVLEGTLYLIVEFQHVKPGKGGAFVRTKLKNLTSGGTIEKTFRAGEKVEDAFIETRQLQFLYATGPTYHFMDQESYEQFTLEEDVLSGVKEYLIDGMEITGSFHNGTILTITPPVSVELKITETEPGFRGDTAKGGSKPATLETGAVVQVPLFVNTDDVIKVDTRTGEYISRV